MRRLTRAPSSLSSALCRPEGEIDSLNAARIAGQTDDEVRQPVRELEAARVTALPLQV
jgi:hypothetical protein